MRTSFRCGPAYGDGKGHGSIGCLSGEGKAGIIVRLPTARAQGNQGACRSWRTFGGGILPDVADPKEGRSLPQVHPLRSWDGDAAGFELNRHRKRFYRYFPVRTRTLIAVVTSLANSARLMGSLGRTVVFPSSPLMMPRATKVVMSDAKG